ncbi:MAG: quinone-dependent dihydroorotate dehydrogenase [Chloroflexota bacterium]
MSLYKNFVFPFLRFVDAETAHNLTLSALSRAQSSAFGISRLKRIAGELPHKPVEIAGLKFPNIIGVAAGFDKDSRVVEGLIQLGFGHVEVGTLTPHPQRGNVRPRVFRLPAEKAVINRMGFPNGGIMDALPRLEKLALQNRKGILGVSLGKQKETPLDKAGDDYSMVMGHAYPYADYFAVNISSPNTPQLRELQHGNYLGDLVGRLKSEARTLARRLGVKERPLFVKIAPDMEEDDLDQIIFTLIASQVDGIIATNTTISRDGVASPRGKQSGGLSGQPIRDKSDAMIYKIARKTEGSLPIIGVGGVQNAQDVVKKLDAGASLVQLYTGMIFEGPAIAGNILREIYPFD